MKAERLWLLFLVQAAYGLPINLADNDSNPISLAILLAIFLLLCILLLSKLIFIKKRRAKFESSSPERSFTADSCYRFSESSHSDVPISSTCAEIKNGDPGLLVGFFGSPSWETKVKCVAYKTCWREHEQSSFFYQLHTKSRRVPQSSSLNTHHSASGRSRHNSASVSRSGSLSITSVVGSHVLFDAENFQRDKLPTAVARRFSLPSVGRRDIHNPIDRKRHSSLKSTNSRRSDVSISSFPANSSLRLVETMNKPEPPLPLSPRQRYHNWRNLDGSGSGHSLPGPIPVPVPVPLPLPQPVPPAVCPTQPEYHPSAFRISHPYALSPPVKRNSRQIQRNPNRSATIDFRAVPTILFPSPKADCQSPMLPRKPFASVAPALNFHRLEMPFPSPSLSPTLSSFPSPPLNTVTTAPPQVKQKQRSPPVRTRRSPAIGPSPLRTMILPDMSVSDNAELANANQDKENSEPKGRPSIYSHLGLGLPSSSPISQDQQHRGKVVDDDDPNVLLGLIRELVEETREWDASLFMDENFKAMIQVSKDAKRESVFSLCVDVGHDESAAGAEVNVVSEAQSVNTASSRNGEGVRYSGGTDLVSFWESGGWGDRNDPRDNVGLAW